MGYARPGFGLVSTLGRLAGDDVEHLLFYHPESGGGVFYRPEGNGDLISERGFPFGKGLTHLEVARFTHNAAADFLAYKASTGRARLFTMDREGRIDRREALRLGRGWTHLVSGNFILQARGDDERVAAQDLLLYNAATGFVRIMVSDGHGQLTPLGRPRRWEAGWTHLVTGLFGGRRTRSDLLAYRRGDGAQGTGQFFTPDQDGRIHALTPPFTLPRATHIAGGRFRYGDSPASQDNPHFVVYDAESGQTDILSVSVSERRYSTLEGIGSPPRPWTHLVTGDFFGERRFSDILFYHAPSGETALWEWTADGLERREISVPPPLPAPNPVQTFQQVLVYNCHAERRGVHIWIRENRPDALWREQGYLPAQYDGSGTCPAAGATPLPITLGLEQYQIVAVDPGALTCGGQNDPTALGCQRLAAVVTGGTSGGVLPITVS